jgi:uncharacterized sporulation protein YeaH/YhbH (DUF444 family)
MHIVDRRLNPGSKNLTNRQRLLRRARNHLKAAIGDQVRERGIRTLEQGTEVSIGGSDLSEPSFRHSEQGGKREQVLFGNKKFVRGDEIPRPPSGGGVGSGRGSNSDRPIEDQFRFVLSAEEFVGLFLEDLELPRLEKRSDQGVDEYVRRRAGYSTTGSPTNLAYARTFRNALARRIALNRQASRHMAQLEQERADLAEVQDPDVAEAAAHGLELDRKITALARHRKSIPFIDPIDVRYRFHEQHPVPIARAVMFCLMDVSGSMDERMKDLAKRFFALLYIFLTKQYERVDIVFIQHTDRASEVDENTFFHSRESGGTVVSSALVRMLEVATERYSSSWNIYAAQASDGDNSDSDNVVAAKLLAGEILPLCQHYAYIEIGADNLASEHNHSALWSAYRRIGEEAPNLALKTVRRRGDIFPVFRALFEKHAT